MDERKRMLDHAWRDLAGWSVGMVDTNGEVCDGRANWEEDEHRLPDPDAPANWGVWLAWCADRFGLGALKYAKGGPAAGRTGLMPWDAEDMESGRCPASALLAATCRHFDFMRERNGVTWDSIPPSVTAWWEAEQQGAAYD